MLFTPAMNAVAIALPSLRCFEPLPTAHVMEWNDERSMASISRDVLLRLCEGHFPGIPIVPGAHLFAIMFDVAVWHVRQTHPGLHVMPRSCRFRRLVHPTYDLTIEVVLSSRPKRAEGSPRPVGVEWMDPNGPRVFIRRHDVEHGVESLADAQVRTCR